jgi:hypothetical protein
MNRILISGSFITEPLYETLSFWVQEISLDCEIKFSYNQKYQTLLAHDNHSDAIFFLIRDKDLFHAANKDNSHFFIEYLRNVKCLISCMFLRWQKQLKFH